MASTVGTTTAAVPDPTPETDVPKASDVEVAAEVKSSDVERDGGNDADIKEATVPQAAYIPAPTTDSAAELPKDVTPGDVEREVNGVSATVVSDRLPPRTSEGGSCPSVNTASTEQSSSTEGEGFASDATWEERTWKELVRLKEDMFWARIGGIRALQG